jgi:hypothetical protein
VSRTNGPRTSEAIFNAAPLRWRVLYVCSPNQRALTCAPRPSARLARHAHHYLAIFYKGNALALYHTKRLASPGQRIVLYANNR